MLPLALGLPTKHKELFTPLHRLGHDSLAIAYKYKLPGK
jgi:hypothetical protein